MKIQDLTSQLKYKLQGLEKRTHVRSNASIVQINGNLYGLTYRLFVPEKNLKPSNVPIPWRAQWQNLGDTTVLCIVKRYANGNFKVLSELPISRPDFNQAIVDTRIFKNPSGNLAISFNTWTKNPKGSMRAELTRTCKGTWNCTYVAKADIEIYENHASMTKVQYPCLNMKQVLPKGNRCYDGQREEKNWVWWNAPKSKQEHISYFVEPHIVFAKDPVNNTCKLVADTSGGHLMKIRSVYPSMNFLLGTPPIKYTTGEYIAVGHMKYNYKKIDVLNDATLKNKVLHFNKSCDEKNPGALIYMMFFYTFSAKAPYEIKRVGHCFVPPKHGKYLLPFPMGITPSADKYVISYGEADTRVRLLTVSKNEIEKMLMPYDKLDPATYKFMVL